eukprot:2053285-Rhodomonas_salina.5
MCIRDSSCTGRRDLDGDGRVGSGQGAGTHLVGGQHGARGSGNMPTRTVRDAPNSHHGWRWLQEPEKVLQRAKRHVEKAELAQVSTPLRVL